MIRKIIRIDKEKCNGCGACADACHEGAIDIINGKAELVREHFCDGLGDCLPECPTEAISFEEREAPAYDEEAVKEAQKKIFAKNQAMSTHTGCPGSRAQSFTQQAPAHACPSSASRDLDAVGSSALSQWPIQIKLVPVNAPYFNDADLLIAADCTAYSYSRFHEDFIKGRITLIGCPKLDDGDYSEKLTEIFTSNKIKSIHLVRMMVPCCGGLSKAVANAIAASGKQIPCTITTISPQGEIIRTERI